MLFLVVGPSGAGKDTLMAAASNLLSGEKRVRFVRRVVTRAANPDGEQHEPVTESEFARREAAGGFALSWRAHGLRYGIPADITLDLQAGRVVVANVSRAVVADAATRFDIRVLEVTASADILARRLAARGREDAVDVARRLSRAIELPMPAPRDVIVNDGTVEAGARKMLTPLRAALA